jgi:hypothetical protein
VLNRLQAVFASFESHGVEYVVIGGIAAVLHGVPRATFDLDILIEASLQNSRRIVEALRATGFGTAEMITPEELVANEITIFQDRVRLDVQTATPGLSFAEVRSRRVRMEFEGQTFYVLSRADLIASKKAAGRPIDLEDVRALEER